MGRKVFVSFKYHDYKVPNLHGQSYSEVHNYVDIIAEKLGSDNVYKGERSDEDLSHLKEDTIWEKIKNRIYDSSVTIVLISDGMRNPNSYDKSQWIPWEVRYSLCEYNKNERISHTNGLLYVVLPDILGDYNYMIEDKTCCQAGCRLYHDNKLFYIMAKNLFNRKEDNCRVCDVGDTVFRFDDSYAIMVKWKDFINDDFSINFYVEMAYQRSLHKEEYNIRTEINRT